MKQLNLFAIFRKLVKRIITPTADLDAAMKKLDLAPDIVRSLHLILASNILGMTCGTICNVGSNPMIGMANDLGAGDMVFGILNAVPQIAVLLQIPAAMLVNYTHKRKRYILTYGIAARILWFIIGFIPFLIPDKIADYSLWSVLILAGTSSALGSFIQVSWFPWLGDLTPPSIRGLWFSAKDAIGSVVSIILGLSVGFAMDHLPSPTRYAILFGIGSISGMLDLSLYAFCKEVYSSPPVKPDIHSWGKGIFSNKQFNLFLVFWTLWCFSANFAGSYLNRYSVNELGLTFTQITVYGSIVSNIVTMIASRAWSHLVIRYGFKPVLWITAVFTSLSQLIFLLARPNEVWPLIMYYGMGSVFWCACNVIANQLQLTLTDNQNRAGSLAVFACVTSILGTSLGIMAGGSLLETFSNMSLPFSLNRYQLVIIIGVTIRFATALFCLPGFQNDSSFTVAGMIKDLSRQ